MRWMNFFQRKAIPMIPIAIVEPVVERDQLEELQTSISMHQARLTSMQEEAAQLGAQLGEITALSPKLKIRISEGDAGATVSLDSLEHEEQEISRRHEGLKLRIASLQAELLPLLRRAAELAGERDQKRQDVFLVTVRQRADEQLEALSVLWREACGAAFDLMSTISEPLSGSVVLDSEHRTAILALKNDINMRLQRLRLERVNGAWQLRDPGFFPDLLVVPGKPRPVPVVTDEIALGKSSVARLSARSSGDVKGLRYLA